MAAVEGWLAAGITRVILGTAALTDPQFVKEAARKFPGRIVVGADAKGGKIATQGWAEVSELTPVDLGRRFEDAGVAAILFTDIDGDGLLKGVNVTATAALARALSIPVIASGGVGSIADIDALMAAGEPGIEGVVVGRALYDGRIDIPAALALTELSGLTLRQARVRKILMLSPSKHEVAAPGLRLRRRVRSSKLLQAGIGDLHFAFILTFIHFVRNMNFQPQGIGNTGFQGSDVGVFGGGFAGCLLGFRTPFGLAHGQVARHQFLRQRFRIGHAQQCAGMACRQLALPDPAP